MPRAQGSFFAIACGYEDADDLDRLRSDPAFKLADYAESITAEFPPEVLNKLNTISDFRKGFELNAELNRALREAGIEGDFGKGGHTPAEWPDFGSVRKTLAEFKGAYDKFRDDILGLFKAAAAPARAAKKAAKKPAARSAAMKRTGRR